MTKTKQDGGTVVPKLSSSIGEYNEMILEFHGGLTIRDWFAGQALAGFCSAMPPDLMVDLANGARPGRYEVDAAFALADRAMLKAREETPEGGQ